MRMELKEILDIFLKNDNYTILTHKSPDGDTLGSGFALCYFLRDLGKHANVINSDQLPSRYAFIYEGRRSSRKSTLSQLISPTRI